MGIAGHLEEFPLQVLLDITNNFSEDHKIGTGSFGSVYQGILEDGRQVAIKRAEVSSSSTSALVTKRQEDKNSAFLNELESLSRLNHRNLVMLLGFCDECNELVLVYEFMSNGTLHDHLHSLESSPFMSWSKRIKVALDAARGIEYLHMYAEPPIIHRDIKSSNILLDTTWTAKVSDFAPSLMGPGDDESHLSLRAAGTVGYIDPEYYRLQKLTTKSDVYSFGVVLLEILSGCRAIHKNENGRPRSVVDFVVPYIVQDEIHRVLDPKVAPPTPYEIEPVAYVGYLAADCVGLERRNRPSMTVIVGNLNRALNACMIPPPTLSRSTTHSSMTKTVGDLDRALNDRMIPPRTPSRSTTHSSMTKSVGDLDRALNDRMIPPRTPSRSTTHSSMNKTVGYLDRALNARMIRSPTHSSMTKSVGRVLNACMIRPRTHSRSSSHSSI